MKKIFTLVLLALLLICGLPVSAQFYETQWEKVNTHLLDRQPVSASKVLDTIESHALEANDQMQLLNAMLYRRKIMLLTVENEPQEAFIRYAEAKIDVLDTIPAAILHVEIGRCYAELLNMYKSKIKNNVDMAGDLSKTEMRYWGQENFKKAIGQHLDAALQAIGKLKQAHTRDYLMLFEEEVRPDVQYLDYEPTLFEFVFHRAANIYQELAKADDVLQAWKLDDWWLPAENFVGLDLGESDSPSLRYLKIFQELIAYTSEIGDETTLIYNDFCRLRFVNTLLQDENAYQKALMQLMEQHAEQPLTADIALELVNSMLKNASPYDAAPEAGNYERATQLCHEVVAKFPETKASDDIINILDELYKTELQITLSRVQLPDENIPVVLNYRNLRHAYLKVVKVSEEEWIQQLYQRWYDKKFIQSLRSQPAYVEQRVHLPAETDMLWHSTMVALQPLEKGFYYLIVMPDRNTLDNDQVSFYGFQVSRLGFITDEKNTIYTIDRKTGQPMGEVRVEHCQRSYNRKTKCNETRVLSKSKSDKDGKVSIRRSTNNFFYANLRKDDDVLLSMPDDYLDFSTGHGFYFTVNTAYYNATLFTDRSIYRPGQTVYYHGIIVKKKGQKESLCKHHSETVYFYDGNSQFIEEQKIRTDEYGSFSGSFVIPNDRLNGTFCIELGSRYTYNSPSDRVYFKVEEYKRPTFEVKFDQPKEQYKVNQEITLNGSVKAFAGFGLDGIECRYQVKRKTSFPWRRYGQTYPTVKDEQMTFGTTKTDNEGKFAIIFNLTPSAKVKPELQPVFTYEIEVTATSAQGETHSETFSVRAGYNEIALSSNLGALVDKSVDAKVHVEAINMSGEPAKSRVMQRIYRYDNAARIDYFEAMQSNITLDRQIYSDMELAKMFPNYDFYLKDDKILVSENEFMLEGEKDLETLSNLGPGRYLLELKSLDDPLAECSNCFVLVDSRTTKMPVTAMQWLQADKAVAHPDDTIHFVLGSSAKEVNAWVKLYHDGKEVLMDQWVEINQGMVNLPYVVTEKDRGMLTFTVAFAKENSFQTIAQRVFVPYDNLDLKVELASVRDKLTPGSEETWEFTVRDNQGQPVKSALLANMYDVSLDELEPEEWKAFNMTPSCYSAYGFTTYPVGSLYKPYLPNLKTFKITLFNFTLPSDAPFFDAAIVRSYTKSSSYNTWSVYSKGPNGRLKGKITDETGETVPFANIIIEKKGVQCGGASSDFDGNYDINPISPGTYDLKASCIGYNAFIVKNIVIPANKITFYDIKMESADIHLEAITVVDYEIPLISKDNTTSGASITAEEIAKLPVRSAEGVAADVGGVFSNDSGAGSFYSFGYEYIWPGHKEPKEVTMEEAERERMMRFFVAPRENFNETAFFKYLKTNADGSASLSFTMPDALTRWRLRLLAYNKDRKTGRNEYTLTSMKPVMIMADMPRYMYDNDTLWFVANVINTGDKVVKPTAKLEIFDAATMEPVNMIVTDGPSTLRQAQGSGTNTGIFTIPMEEIVPGRSKEVRWKVAAQRGLDLLAFRFTAYAGEQSDAEQHILPVLSSDIFMTQTLPMTVQAEAEQTFDFDSVLVHNGNERTQSLTLSFSTNPIWYAVQSLPYLDGINPYCAENAFYVFYANTLSVYISDHVPQLMSYIRKWKVESPDALLSKLEQDADLKAILLQETPWVMQAKTVPEQRSRLAVLFDAIRLPMQQSRALDVMSKQQKASGGWSWFDDMPASSFITTHILTGFGKLGETGAMGSLNWSNREQAEKIISKAYNFLEADIKSIYFDAKNKKKTPVLSSQIVNELYALSFFVKEHSSVEIDEVTGYYLKEMEENWTQYNYSMQAKMALVLYRNDKEKAAPRIIQSLKECARTGKHNGMYWTKDYFTFESDVATHANIMAAFAEIDQDDALLDQMRIWLLSKKRFDRWESSASTLDATYALLLRGSDWFEDGKEVTLRFGNTPVSTEGGVAGTGFIQRRWNANEVTSDMRQLTVNNPTNHLVWGGLFRQYFVPIDEVKSDEAGFTIKRELFVEMVTDEGKVLVPVKTKVPEPVEGPTLKVGDKLTVKITFTSEQDMSYVFVKDLRAAGFEPIEQVSRYEYNDRMSYYQSNTDTDMEFFIERLPKGTHQLEYSMFVTKEGYLNNGYALIQCQYAPEFSAYSDGMRVKVGE